MLARYFLATRCAIRGQSERPSALMTFGWRSCLVKALLKPDESKRAAISRRSASQAGCRGFEPRLPLQRVNRLFASASRAS